MFKRIKILTLPLLLAAILAAPSFSGCGEKAADTEGTAAGGLTTQELKQVMADAMSAVKNATSYGFSLDMDMNAEATGGSQAGKMGMTMKSSADADIAANNMKMDLKMSLESDIPGNEGSQSVSAEIYMLTDWLYMKMKISGMGEQWLKTPVTEDVKQAYDLDMVNQQLAPLESMGEIKFVKYETVDGSKCYVLKIVPDMESMKDWLDQQQMTSGTFDWSQVENLGDIFKELSYTVWIAKDTKLMKKLKLAMSIEMTPELAGVSESDFDKMTMDIGLDMEIQNYNKPVSVILPDEAENATEM
jgi:hypothetical protein